MHEVIDRGQPIQVSGDSGKRNRVGIIRRRARSGDRHLLQAADSAEHGLYRAAGRVMGHLFRGARDPFLVFPLHGVAAGRGCAANGDTLDLR